MTPARAVAVYALREALRRRVFAVVIALTVVFLGLYALAAEVAFDSVSGFGEEELVDDRALTGGTLLGLATRLT